MHTHIIGICGTFMAGIANLAHQLGHRVTGCDLNVYPPMSIELENLGIEITKGFGSEQLDLEPDSVVIGNVATRGMEVVEELLQRRDKLTSGPSWLYDNILKDKYVLAVSGTHGKTTTTSILAWILQYANYEPGYLIGGVCKNFAKSSNIGKGKYFVLEADEYDTAFFDKRSKFIHYRPQTLIINNLEYDHADIFSSLDEIKKQFHHMVRIMPRTGSIISPDFDDNVKDVLTKGLYSNSYSFTKNDDLYENVKQTKWCMQGEHNINNAVAAIMAAKTIGIDYEVGLKALQEFKGVKRRLELIGTTDNGAMFYDDFAHHPTAILQTLNSFKMNNNTKENNLIAVVDISSNTMKQGVHKDNLAESLKVADRVYFYKSNKVGWDVEGCFNTTQKPGGVYTNINDLSYDLLCKTNSNDKVVFMSNGSFGGIYASLGLKMSN